MFGLCAAIRLVTVCNVAIKYDDRQCSSHSTVMKTAAISLAGTSCVEFWHDTP